MEKPSLSICGDRNDSSDASRDVCAAKSQINKLSVLMPVYNERWTLSAIVRRVLTSPVPLEIELVVVDDCSKDGSWELLQELAAGDPRIKPFRHERNGGKGTAIRTAIGKMTGDVAVIQDADLEYDPHELPTLLAPILNDKADAVFGSRFVGHPRQVLNFWHGLRNQMLTLFSNMLNDLQLTDMETCYKMVRADVLRSLRLTSATFTLEPEISCRLAQYGARIHEVPISYAGRSFLEGKKIRALDGLKALGVMFHRRFIDTQFTNDAEYQALRAGAKNLKRNRWIFDQIKPYLGDRVLEAGSGIGSLSAFLLNKKRLLLAEKKADRAANLHRRFGYRENVRVDCVDIARKSHCARWQDERLNTVLCPNAADASLAAGDNVLGGFHDILEAGGHCIVLSPQSRRYADNCVDCCNEDMLAWKMAAAGFDVVFRKRFTSASASGAMSSSRLAQAFNQLFPRSETSLTIVVGRKPQQIALQKAA